MVQPEVTHGIKFIDPDSVQQASQECGHALNILVPFKKESMMDQTKKKNYIQMKNLLCN